MRVLLTTFLILFLFENSNGQTSIFKTTYLSKNDSVIKEIYIKPDLILFKTKFDTLAVNEKIDIGFYRKHFRTPYYCPQQFVSEQYKDTTIEKWANEGIEKDFVRNWTYTYVYDGLSRVINYNFSGCWVCSQLPFYTSIFYDELNRPIKIQWAYSPFKKPEEDYEEIVIKYDDNGDIVQLKENFGFRRQIEKIASDN